MTQMVTRCPKCATAFRITSTQLESAKGAVRCGSCLHIFKADDYLIDKSQPANTGRANTDSNNRSAATASQSKSGVEQPTSKAPVNTSRITTTPESKKATTSQKQTTTIKKTTTSPEQTKSALLKRKLVDDDDMLISDDMDKPVNKDSAYAMDSFLDINLQPKQTGSLFDREIKYEPHVEKQHIDESWADQLLSEDGEETTAHFKKPNAAPRNHTEPVKASPKAVAPPPPKAVPKVPQEQPKTHQPAVSKSAPVFSLITDNHTNNNTHNEGHEFSDAFLTATRPSSASDETHERELAVFSESLFEDSDEPSPTEQSKKSLKSQPKITSGINSRASLLMNIMPAPIEFSTKRMRNWYHKKLWRNLAALSLVTLFFQLAYFKFDYFSRVEPYRSAYVFVCPVFRCQVPSLIDRNQISAYNLVVRNHPDVKNGLIVDAIILNKAPFPQPFPDITLAFSTLDETPVASRRFSPKEYLGGELAGMEQIPIKQPVHITLELADPGPTAVNYHMGIAQ
jgi:predicted Zn finger-like uncharacterized protein